MENPTEKVTCTRPPTFTPLHTPCEHVPDAPHDLTGEVHPHAKPAQRLYSSQYIIFSDLDHTVIPLDTRGIDRFAQLIRSIQTKGQCSVRFVPISGRSSDYVRCFCHTLRTNFRLLGPDLDGVIDLASGEQGATVIDCDKSYHVEYLGDADEADLKLKVVALLQTLPPALKAIIRDEPAKLYTCSLHITTEAAATMSPDQKQECFAAVQAHMEAGLGKGVAVYEMSHKTLEVMPRSVSKSHALRHLLRHYHAQTDVSALSYSGDAPNDRECIEYVTRLAEVPGVCVHAFLPSNAHPSLSSSALEGCKDRLKCPHECVEKAPAEGRPYWHGVMDLIEAALEAGTLLGQGQGQGQGQGDRGGVSGKDDLTEALRSPSLGSVVKQQV